MPWYLWFFSAVSLALVWLAWFGPRSWREGVRSRTPEGQVPPKGFFWLSALNWVLAVAVALPTVVLVATYLSVSEDELYDAATTAELELSGATEVNSDHLNIIVAREIGRPTEDVFVDFIELPSDDTSETRLGYEISMTSSWDREGNGPGAEPDNGAAVVCVTVLGRYDGTGQWRQDIDSVETGTCGAE